MSESALPIAQRPRGSDGGVPSVRPERPAAPRTPAQRVLADLVKDWGARVGLAWIVVIAFLGIFAPLLANSFPLLVKVDGKVSSPLIRNLNWADVTLLAGTLFAVPWCIIARRLLWRWRLIIVAVVFGILSGITFLTIRPPAIAEFSAYRALEADGKVEWIIRTPIPFSPTDRLRDEAFDITRPHPRPPSSTHWMGTETNGSDIAARMVHACRVALTIGFISTGISTVIGVIVGAFMGYFAGWVDLIGGRILEIFSAIPTLFLMLAAVAFFGRGLYIIMIIIGLTTWVGVARFVRAEFLRYRSVDFVMAAQALGLPLRSILFRHLLPNALAPVLVEVSFGVAGAILAESGLSFLGLGLIDEPSWGALLNQAVGATGGFQWWLAVYPGLAIFLTVFAYNLIGEAFRDALDPKLKKRE